MSVRIFRSKLRVSICMILCQFCEKQFREYVPKQFTEVVALSTLHTQWEKVIEFTIDLLIILSILSEA